MQSAYDREVCLSVVMRQSDDGFLLEAGGWFFSSDVSDCFIVFFLVL